MTDIRQKIAEIKRSGSRETLDINTGKIKIKHRELYTVDTSKKKRVGVQPGEWVQRTEGFSKKSRWLFKGSWECGGPKVKEILAIREAYAGELYRLLMPDNTPKTRLVERPMGQNPDEPKYLVASKEIPQFEEFDSLRRIRSRLEEQQNTDALRQMVKVAMVSILLGEEDFKPANLGICEGKLMKIDHGQSLALGHDGRFNETANFGKYHIASMLNISPQEISDEILNSVCKEILDKVNDDNILNEVTNKYEDMFNLYRNNVTAKDVIPYLIGQNKDTIKDNLSQRLEALQLFYQENVSEDVHKGPQP